MQTEQPRTDAEDQNPADSNSPIVSEAANRKRFTKVASIEWSTTETGDPQTIIVVEGTISPVAAGDCILYVPRGEIPLLRELIDNAAR